MDEGNKVIGEIIKCTFMVGVLIWLTVISVCLERIADGVDNLLDIAERVERVVGDCEK